MSYSFVCALPIKTSDRSGLCSVRLFWSTLCNNCDLKLFSCFYTIILFLNKKNCRVFQTYYMKCLCQWSIHIYPGHFLGIQSVAHASNSSFGCVVVFFCLCTNSIHVQRASVLISLFVFFSLCFSKYSIRLSRILNSFTEIFISSWNITPLKNSIQHMQCWHRIS